jgi:hypothetical protein
MSITLQTVIAVALRHDSVMHELGDALRSDIVTASPHLRHIVEFADDFVTRRHRLPSGGDFDVWLETLPKGLQDGARQKLAELSIINADEFDPAFFVEATWPVIHEEAHRVAMHRVNEANGAPDAWRLITERLASLKRRGAVVTQTTKLFATDLVDIREMSAADSADEKAEVFIPNLAWRSKLVLLSAAPKLGKGTLVAAGVIAFGRREPFLDDGDDPMRAGVHRDECDERRPGKTLWLALDEGKGDANPRVFKTTVGDMMRMWCSVQAPASPLAFIQQALDDPDPAQRPDLIVVDSLTTYVQRVCAVQGKEPPKSGDAMGWSELMRPLAGIAQTRDVCILVIHHARKDGGGPRDSTEIEAACDVSMQLLPPRPGQGPTARNITMTGRHTVIERERRFPVYMTTETSEVETPNGPVVQRRNRYHIGDGMNAAPVPEANDRQTRIDADVLAFITTRPGCYQQDIVRAFSTRGRNALERLESLGQITRAKVGKGWQYRAVATGARQSPDVVVSAPALTPPDDNNNEQ